MSPPAIRNGAEMTGSTASHAIPVGRRRLADRIRSGQRQISDRVHSAADARARARGWTVTESTGRFGMGARTYRDPGFSTRPRSTSNDTPLRRRTA
jgi:hypothetical protein